MSKITGKVNYKEVLKGNTGYTFEPHVTVDGILYWTNNGGLENPLPVNLHGKQGFMFIPHVDDEGNLSWTNTGELENPPTVNIKGDKGYFYTPHISQDGILTWSNNGNLENPQPFNISDLILNEVKESRIDTTGKTFSKLKERLDSDFKKLSETIKNNDTKDEVVQARTATTGENFMTLDDRIDHEVMRLREKIEVTMLEQEDKESHDISNTIDGMSSDMIIKGRTLQDLAVRQIPTIGSRSVVLNDIELNSNKIYVLFYKEQGSTQLNIFGEYMDGSSLSHAMFIPNNSPNGVYIYEKMYDKPLKTVSLITLENGDRTTGKAMLFKDNYKYSGEYFEGIKSFGQQEDKISILSHGRNLMNSNDITNNSIQNFSNNNGIISGTFSRLNQGTNNGNFKVSKKTKVIIRAMCKGCRIIIKRCWLENGEYRKIIATDNYSNNLNTHALGTRICYIDKNSEWYVENPHNIENNNFEIKNIFCYVLEDNNSNYEPYKEDKKDILLQDLGFDEGLRGINDISDELNSLRNVAIKRIGKREYREGDLLLDNVITDKVNTYYVLEDPIETPLDENINVKTFNDKTYVNFENSINGTSSFKVPVNTNKLINDLKFEKEDLKEKFNNLTTEFENFKTYMIQTLPYKEV